MLLLSRLSSAQLAYICLRPLFDSRTSDSCCRKTLSWCGHIVMIEADRGTLFWSIANWSRSWDKSEYTNENIADTPHIFAIISFRPFTLVAVQSEQREDQEQKKCYKHLKCEVFCWGCVCVRACACACACACPCACACVCEMIVCVEWSFLCQII